MEEDNEGKRKGNIDREERLVQKEDSCEITLWEGRRLLGILPDRKLIYPEALKTSTRAAWNISEENQNMLENKEGI